MAEIRASRPWTAVSSVCAYSLAQWRAAVLGSDHAHVGGGQCSAGEPTGRGTGERSKIRSIIEVAIHLVPATKLPRLKLPPAAALVGIGSLATLIMADGFTRGSTTTVPEQIRPRSEMSNGADGIRSRPVQTIAVLGQSEERPAAGDAHASHANLASHSELDRAKAGLVQRPQQFPVRLGNDQNSFASPVSQTDPVQNQSAAIRPKVTTKQLAAREDTSAEPAQPAQGSPSARQGAEEHTPGLRVVIHWPTHDNLSAELAKGLTEDFRQKGWVAAALKSVRRPVRHFEIRYPDRDTRSSAVQVKAELLRTLGKYGGSGSTWRLRRKRTANSVIEVWIPRSVR